MAKKIGDNGLYALTQFLDIDITKGEMSVFNQRVGLFPLNAILELFNVFKEELGEKKTRDLVYKTGVKFGRYLLNQLLALDENEFIDINPLMGSEEIGKILSFFGLGKIDYTQNDENHATLKYYNSPVSENKNNLFCSLLQGIIQGALYLIYDKNLTVNEEACITKGNDCCIFKIRF